LQGAYGGKKQFDITLTLDVKENKADGQVPFFSTTMSYADAGYDGLVSIQHYLLEAVQKIHDLGFVQAAAMGLGDKLSAFEPFKEKLKALGQGKK
jgi:hypothetical protein